MKQKRISTKIKKNDNKKCLKLQTKKYGNERKKQN